MAIKLVALDLDDTLLDSGLRISPDCIKAIQEVRRQGVRVTISTGRMYSSALPYAHQLAIDVPLITYQGAWVKSSLSGEVLYYKPVPGLLAGQIMGFFKDVGVHLQSYFNDQVCMEQLTPEGAAYARMAGVEAVLVKDLAAELARQEAIKILAITNDEEKILKLEKALKSKYNGRLHITRSKPHYLEVMHPEADKAMALQVVARHYGIEQKEVMAIGDSYNDMAMIEWAGIGVAMGNACPAVKAAADYVTGSNEEEGVSEALRRFVLDA